MTSLKQTPVVAPGLRARLNAVPLVAFVGVAIGVYLIVGSELLAAVTR